jgi:hypothetical protein
MLARPPAVRQDRGVGAAGVFEGDREEYTTTVDIRTTSEVVWAILTDGPEYANWNPEISRVEAC